MRPVELDTGPPRQKEGPHRWVQAKSQGLSDTRTLLSVTPSRSPMQAGKKTKCR